MPDLTGVTPVPPFQNIVRVAQASGLLFWASRPKPSGDVDWLWFVRTTRGGRWLTKSGVTPDLTGVTPVPPFQNIVRVAQASGLFLGVPPKTVRRRGLALVCADNPW